MNRRQTDSKLMLSTWAIVAK